MAIAIKSIFAYYSNFLAFYIIRDAQIFAAPLVGGDVYSAVNNAVFKIQCAPLLFLIIIL